MDFSRIKDVILNMNPIELKNCFIGGIVISFASTFNLCLTGRSTNISLSLFKSFDDPKNNFHNWCLILGILFTSSFYSLFYGLDLFDTPNQFIGDISIIFMLFSSFLVGFGSKLSNGSVSGHSIFGMSFMNRRSLIFTIIFLTSGMITANYKFENQLLIKGQLLRISYFFINNKFFFLVFCLICLTFFVLLMYQTSYRESINKTKDALVSFLTGVFYACGLMFSGISKKSTVLQFFKIEGWNPSFYVTIFTASLLNSILSSFVVKKIRKPIAVNFGLLIPTQKTIDLKLVIGATLFGVGLGIGGIYPSSFLINSYMYLPHSLIYMVGLILGSKVSDRLEYRIDCNTMLNKLKIE